MAPILISIFSLLISVVGLGFAIFSWRETNRPVLVARVATVRGDNENIFLNLVVENTGNRPAKNIQLIACLNDVKAIIDQQGDIHTDANRCFFSNVSIPVLANGKAVSNAFGHLGRAVGAWTAGSTLPLKIKYSDLKDRKFSEKIELLLADDAGFAQTFWESTIK